nr:double homeobox protein 4C-like [Loxodonta africana]
MPPSVHSGLLRPGCPDYGLVVGEVMHMQYASGGCGAAEGQVEASRRQRIAERLPGKRISQLHLAEPRDFLKESGSPSLPQDDTTGVLFGTNPFRAWLSPAFPGAVHLAASLRAVRESPCSPADLPRWIRPALRGRRERLVLKPSQRETLQAAFEQNPYPGITTREELARETGIAEDRIQTWFGNRRAGHLRKSRSASGQASEEEPSQGQGEPQPWSPENFPKAARRKRTRITRSQTSLLVEAFEKNRYPGNEAKEELAQRTGLPRSRIHVWFQNRRARKLVQSASAPPKSLADSPTSAATLPLDQSDLSSVQSTYPLGPPSHPSSSNQAILPVLTESRPPFLPSEPTQGCAGQAPGVVMDQPALIVKKTAETSHAPGTHLNRSPTGPTVGDRLSDPQAPFWPQYPGNDQDRDQHAVSAGWLAQDPSRPDNSKTQGQVPAQQVTAPFTQWGCEVAQGVTADGNPAKRHSSSPDTPRHTCGQSRHNRLKGHLIHQTKNARKPRAF